MHPRKVILHQVSAFLIASKFDELDENITVIEDLKLYIEQKLQHLGKRDPTLIPSRN